VAGGCILAPMSTNNTATEQKELSRDEQRAAHDRAFFESQIERGEPMLVGINTGRELVFPDPETRPSIRAFNDWKNKGFFPSVKIGKRVFIDPAQVRLALESRFTINAQ
jgi:hypothetical protein